MNDRELMSLLIPLWHAHRRWAEELLVRTFAIENPKDILNPAHKGRKRIPGTNWSYRTHGIGVDVYRTEQTGGIDFDFDKDEPDAWRLAIFFEKQYNAGNLHYDNYRHLFEDEELAKTAVEAAVEAYLAQE